MSPRTQLRFLLPLALAASLHAQSLQPTQSLQPSQLLQPAPASTPAVTRLQSRARTQTLSQDAKLALLRQHIKYVFILFQENRSFDYYFGTYPVAEGLFSHPAAETPGFVQPLVDTDGTVTTISPFRIPVTVPDRNGHTVPLYPTDTASVNHAHLPMVRKLDLDADGIPRNDRYALTEEGVTLDAQGKPNKLPTLERKQFGELVMGHLDCDTAPFLWQYADRFTLFDHFFDTVVGPSGPNAIAMIAGQSGETQWMLHPDLGAGTVDASGTAALPLVTNAHPYWSLPLDPAGNPAPPVPNPEKVHAPNLTFATLPLSFMGADIQATTAQDLDPGLDLKDVQQDILKIAGNKAPAVPWGWYQQGYNHEPTDPAGIASHKQYVIHHNGPQYFGYVADNPAVSAHMHGLGDFFADISARALPPTGVFYIRGGYGNIAGFPPADPNPKLATVYHGNDDHPGYADSGISEAFLAREVNAIAQSPYWSQSVILIAYDESDGLYDHARPRIRSRDAAGLPLDQGPRIPFLLISPFAATHVISHELTEHSSIIRFVDELFGMVPLADLPDETRAREIGLQTLQQKDLGPADDKVEGVGNLFSGFDDQRLLGKRSLLPAAYAVIPEPILSTFPHYAGHGCSTLGIRPTDTGRPNPVPDDFNPRPDTTPGLPRSGTWTP